MMEDETFSGIGCIYHKTFWIVDLKNGQKVMELQKTGARVEICTDDYKVSVSLDYEGTCYFDEEKNMIRCDILWYHELDDFIRLDFCMPIDFE